MEQKHFKYYYCNKSNKTARYPVSVSKMQVSCPRKESAKRSCICKKKGRNLPIYPFFLVFYFSFNSLDEISGLTGWEGGGQGVVDETPRYVH